MILKDGRCMRILSIGRTYILLPALLIAFSASGGPCASVLGQKIDLEILLAKHPDSIGSPEARAAVKSRILSGTSQVIFRTTPVGQAIGKAVLASEGSKSLIGMSFPSPVYPREQLGFDGASFIAAFATPGTRSVLGNFLMTNDVIFKYGLMSGTLSSAWPLLNGASSKTQWKYVGTKQVEGHSLHEVRYVPRSGSDLTITLFFEPETFRHVRTEYERVIAAQMDTRSYTNVTTRESRYKMVEDFSLFKAEGGLNLPHIYAIKLTIDTQGGTSQAEWTIKLTNFEFNQKIDPAAFKISAN